MPVRNRFDDLAQMPDVITPGANSAEIGTEYEVEEEEDSSMDAFFAEVKQIRDNIQAIEENVAVVEHKHQDLLVAYSQKQTQEANEALEKIMNEISAIANKVRTQLQRMDKANKDAEHNLEAGSADMRIRKSQHSTLSRKFISVMTTYNDIQAANKRKYREAIQRQCRIVDPDIKDEVVDHLLETGTTADIFKGRRLDEAEQALSDIKDRHEDILRLERSLKELHEMFLDMAILVRDQGDMIDRIEHSVDKATNYVERARRQVQQAEQYQTQARHKRICCYVCLLLAIGVVVAIVMSVIPTE
eukprot:m.338751 g.338751  ORF g.338751 m.338751 type:complete len:302 (-) comp18534_c0_seq1:90-995(-)